MKASTTSSCASPMVMVGGGVGTLRHDVGLLEADGQPELLAGSGQLVHEALQAFFTVGCKGGVVCKQQLTEQHLVALGLGTESCNVEEFAILPRPDVRSIFTVGEGVPEEHRQEDPEEGWC